MFTTGKTPPLGGEWGLSRHRRHSLVALRGVPGDGLVHGGLRPVLEQLVVASNRTEAFIRLDEAPGRYSTVVHGLGHGRDYVEHSVSPMWCTQGKNPALAGG